MRKYLPLLLVLMFVCPTSCFAWEVTLGWDPNTEKELAGYKVYYDTSSGDPYYGTEADQGTSPITILCEDLPDPNDPEFTLTGLVPGYRYYFAVTAFSVDDMESGYSNEVSTDGEDAESGSDRSSDGGGGGQGCFISTLGGYRDSSKTYK